MCYLLLLLLTEYLKNKITVIFNMKYSNLIFIVLGLFQPFLWNTENAFSYFICLCNISVARRLIN